MKMKISKAVAALPTIWIPRMLSQVMKAMSANETSQCFQPVTCGK